jgi:hypothetical protein
MILQRILDYLEQHRLASGEQIARALGANPGAVEAMLATLERHHRVRRLPAQACGSCQQRCADMSTVFFAPAEDGRSQALGACAVELVRGAAAASHRD